MAATPEVQLVFRDGCPDCGERRADLPKPLPPIDDHFDWDARDYDSIRMFAMEELAARYPERTRWTPADMEVVLVELIASLLDQLLQHPGRRPWRGEAGNRTPSGVGPPAARADRLRRDDRDAPGTLWRRDRRRQPRR